MMEVIEKMTDKEGETLFPMNEMKIGQVCYYPLHDHYVLRIQSAYMENSLFLILGNNDTINFYYENCTTPVRRLRKGESVTIRFS